jgi:hypothetical protein
VWGPSDWCDLRPVRAEPGHLARSRGHDACTPQQPVVIPLELNT